MLDHLAPAYLDPGTGSLIVQTVIATILGSVIVFKSFWRQVLHRVKSVFSGKKTIPTDSADEKTA
jgi:hypothetical protein